MLWIVFALLTAFFESIKDVTYKHNLRNIDEYVVAFSVTLITPLLLFPLFLFIGVPKLGEHFFQALFITSIIQGITVILYMKAIKASDLSITIPMVAFSPLFLLITSPIIVGEFPTPLGVLGIVFVVIGSYLLNIRQRKNGYLAPLHFLLKEKGPRLMLIVALLWSVGANFDKVGVLNSSPLFWMASTDLLTTLFFLPILLTRSKNVSVQIKNNIKPIIIIGLLSFAFIFQLMALKLTLVAYVISVKRTSVIMSALAGFLLFKEKGLRERLAGAVIMVIGVAIIALST